MAASFASRPIRDKLIGLCTVTAICALMVACASFWLYESAVYMQTLKKESRTMAQMLADSSAAALMFDDRAAARETAETLRAEPRATEACFYNRQGSVVATYQRYAGGESCPLPTHGAATAFSWRHLSVYYPVTLNGEYVGSLYLEMSLAEMYTRSLRYAFISVVVLCVAMLVAILLSSRLQHLISDPILHLTRVAGEVSVGGSYKLRAIKSSNDETGMLIDQFNAMMEQVNQRDLELQRAQDELELRVEERTQSLRSEIAERKLVEQSLVNAKLAAEEANKAKSAFLANMSHELRTPLNAILGYSEMLEEESTLAHIPSATDDLQRIQSAGHHLLALVNDILDISKIEAGAIEVHMEDVPMTELIDGIVPTVELLARKRGNSFTVRFDSRASTIRVDPMKFRQCLLNLLSNACKFTQGGTITLSVTHCDGPGGKSICWQVRDTGIGIAEEDTRRLFVPFSQIDSSATRSHGGTGLGLAISQRLSKLMGGYISVDSIPGVGSTFTIHMPERPLEVFDLA
jgi:signal transduction histidine kinase